MSFSEVRDASRWVWTCHDKMPPRPPRATFGTLCYPSDSKMDKNSSAEEPKNLIETIAGCQRTKWRLLTVIVYSSYLKELRRSNKERHNPITYVYLLGDMARFSNKPKVLLQVAVEKFNIQPWVSLRKTCTGHRQLMRSPAHRLGRLITVIMEGFITTIIKLIIKARAETAPGRVLDSRVSRIDGFDSGKKELKVSDFSRCIQESVKGPIAVLPSGDVYGLVRITVSF
ncbi:hypothetical protein EVAR_18359_1 [Eumeta japonica]|uniref:Uncharacterized protein n=1 Tax=Eumeta variegata TaxID=151549 RepID=A0A4C1UUH3_EUMVA|nr:hypothetical protein EVAR_18359_1 [Eumeta japonica]